MVSSVSWLDLRVSSDSKTDLRVSSIARLPELTFRGQFHAQVDLSGQFPESHSVPDPTLARLDLGGPKRFVRSIWTYSRPGTD